MAESSENVKGKSRKRQSVKAAGRPSASKVKTTVHLSADAVKRLGVHAAMLGTDRSELVEGLIQQHLRRFVVSDRGEAESGNSEIPESLNS